MYVIGERASKFDGYYDRMSLEKTIRRSSSNGSLKNLKSFTRDSNDRTAGGGMSKPQQMDLQKGVNRAEPETQVEEGGGSKAFSALRGSMAKVGVE